jgi:hypothetical protein
MAWTKIFQLITAVAAAFTLGLLTARFIIGLWDGSTIAGFLAFGALLVTNMVLLIRSS